MPFDTPGKPGREAPEVSLFDSPAMETASPRKMYKQLGEIFNGLPGHFSGRVRDLDNLMTKLVVEVHSILVLSINEMAVADPALLYSLEESLEWDEWYADFRKSLIQFRKALKQKLKLLPGILPHLDQETKTNIESYVDLNEAKVRENTGLQEFPANPKQGLGDIAAILGREGENKINHEVRDQTVKVGGVDTDGAGQHRERDGVHRGLVPPEDRAREGGHPAVLGAAEARDRGDPGGQCGLRAQRCPAGGAAQGHLQVLPSVQATEEHIEFGEYAA